MTYTQFQILMLFWNMGLVDTFSVIKLCINCGSQYVGVVLSSAAGNFSDIGPKVLFEPVLGLGTGYQFVKAASSAARTKPASSFILETISIFPSVTSDCSALRFFFFFELDMYD